MGPSMSRETYTVETKRWELGLELHITGPGVDGVSQTHFLDDAVFMARDYIANSRGVPADSFDVVLRPQSTGFYEDVGALVVFRQKMPWTWLRIFAYSAVVGVLGMELGGIVAIWCPDNIRDWVWGGLTAVGSAFGAWLGAKFVFE